MCDISPNEDSLCHSRSVAVAHQCALRIAAYRALALPLLIALHMINFNTPNQPLFCNYTINRMWKKHRRTHHIYALKLTWLDMNIQSQFAMQTLWLSRFIELLVKEGSTTCRCVTRNPCPRSSASWSTAYIHVFSIDLKYLALLCDSIHIQAEHGKLSSGHISAKYCWV